MQSIGGKSLSLPCSLCSWTSVLLLFSCSNVLSNEAERQCYCVVPDHTSSSTNSPCGYQTKCYTLTHFVDTGAFKKDNGVFHFLSGNHNLQKVVEVSKHPHRLTQLKLIGNCSESEMCSDLSMHHRPSAVVQCIENKDNINAGFNFSNVVNLSIVGLGFNNCGFISDDKYSGALNLQVIWNLYMCGVEINASRGWALSLSPVYGRALITKTNINGGHNVSLYTGGNLYLDYYKHIPSSDNDTSINITHCNITNGINRGNSYGGGLHVYLETTNSINVRIENVYFKGNQAGHGGNVAIIYKSLNGTWPSSVTFVNCHFISGVAYLGGGLYITMLVDDMYREYTCTNRSKAVAISVRDSHFQENSAETVGGGVYLQLHEDPLLKGVAVVLFYRCVLEQNINLKSNSSRGGSAVNLINFHVPGFTSHLSPQYNISFISCNFTRNHAVVNSADSVGSGTLYMEENALTFLKDSSFLDNKNTGITSVHSNIQLEGNITLRNNIGYNGGGMVMCANSVLYIDLNVSAYVLIENCHAENVGGGIYAEFECSQAIPPCFFQVSDSKIATETLFHLHNNTAERAGAAIYGGAVDQCYSYGPYIPYNKSAMFENLFEITPKNNNSISSDPMFVCFCIGGTKNCSIKQSFGGSIYPGGTLSLSLVVVGQRNGTVPGIVVPLPINAEHIELKPQQNTNDTDEECMTLNYTIIVDYNILLGHNETIKLTVGNKNFINNLLSGGDMVSVTVKIEECPLGFSFDATTKQCGCARWVESLPAITTCNIATESIDRNANSTWWIGILKNTDGINKTAIYSQFCPFDYCTRKARQLHVTENFEDHQCANNRTGILCGSCKETQSAVLGSTACKPCNIQPLALRVLGLLLLFAALGIVLVFVVGALNMTVSEGTLNAIIFYMNVVRVNTSIIFYSKETNLRPIVVFLEVFVAWMNLDWGIETCFYNGMEAIGKTALQFVFPLYLFCLSVLMIYVSRRSSLVTKLFGKNVVQILATIIFQFYAKIIRTIIDVLRASMISSESNKANRLVWTNDGSVEYLNKYHTILLAIAVSMAAVTLPYTLALLFIQCLRKRSNMRVFFWVNKLKPFFDAYTGPYKDKYHFWTGFLLMVRLTLFTAIAMNISKGALLNLSLIIATTSLLFVLTQPGIYKNWALNLVETFTYSNLTVLAACTAYCMRDDCIKDVAVLTCVGSMFFLFCGVVTYHVSMKLFHPLQWRDIKVWLLDRRRPWIKRTQLRSVIPPYIDIDTDEESSSGDEMDPIPPVARYDEYREPLIETEETN